MFCAWLLAAQKRESGVWLNTLPRSAIGLWMDGTVQVAIGLCLGVTLCLPHDCQHCRTKVNSLGTHGLSCHRGQGRHSCHEGINALIQRHLSSAGIPAQIEPMGVWHSDGKEPNGASITLWKRVLVWDIMCPDTYAPSHIGLDSNEIGLVAAQAEQLKNRKYMQSYCLATI